MTETHVAFGRELQHERERRGISLDAVAAGTKVAPRYLHALENDDLASLPGGVFNKGFVRSYCRYVGLDEDLWLERLAANAHTHGGEPDWTAFAENVRNNRARTTPAMRRRWWGVALMVAALLAVAWATWRYVVRSREVIDAPPVRAGSTQAPSDAPSP